MPEHSLSIVVLAWNKADLTRTCVDSLREGTDVPYELIIVDNGSEDAAASYASEAADIAILNERNRGFAIGMNQGLAAATGDIVAFVNNDTRFPSKWASNLVDIASRPTTGIVVPAVTHAGMPTSQRDEPGENQLVAAPFADLPSGVVYVMRRNLAVDLGGWDESYEVASAEDFDLLFTVWANDLDVVIDERTLIHHVGSATASTELVDHRERWVANRKQFLEKWAAVTPENVAYLGLCDRDRFENNLALARLAAVWMERWFSTSDALSAERSRIRALRAEAAGGGPSLASKVRRRLRASLRR